MRKRIKKKTPPERINGGTRLVPPLRRPAPIEVATLADRGLELAVARPVGKLSGRRRVHHWQSGSPGRTTNGR